MIRRTAFAVAMLCMATLCFPIYALADGIKTAADLVEFATALNTGGSIDQWRNEKGEVCLEADIDMAKVKKFESISSFGGVFDGQGHSIKNWKAKSGLFDQLLKGGIIRNLSIDKSCVMKASNKTSGEYYCGFIANHSNGLIRDCENHGEIIHKSNYAENKIFIGGVVGSSRWAVLNCANYGKISSNCVSTVQKSGVLIGIGGVIGGSDGKLEAKPCIAWCNNHGDIIYGGDFPVVSAAGVVGYPTSITIKYCMNRGNVNVSASSSEGDWKIRGSYVGGVAGNIHGCVFGSDNFGTIKSSGSHTAAAGGVVAHPYSKGGVVITDCVNYGNVSLDNTTPSNIGGLIGSVACSIHLNGCVNHGDVTYDGFSPDRPSYVGGIIGQITASRKDSYASYLRNCVNYGTVFSGTGGNNYENEKAIKVGGFAGQIIGLPTVSTIVRGCENKGKISSLGGRRSSLVATTDKVSFVGEYHESFAKSAEPMPDGSNIYGKVVTADGKPLPGVVVSDGLQCVITDPDGNYRMKSKLEDVRFIMVSPPSGYEAESESSIPQTFLRVKRHEVAVKADFSLKYTGEKDDYTMIMIGDPQMRRLNADGSGERFRDVVIPDIEQLQGDNQNFYAINLGDLVYNWMNGWDDYVDISATASFPMYNLVGNHDLDQANLFDVNLGTAYYENYIGPTYYSFNIGKVHYVMLNTILTDAQSVGKRNYTYGITDEAIKWLTDDLSYVPKDMTLVICSHALLFQGNSQNDFKYRNGEKLRAEIEKFSKIYAWGGHSHLNYGCHHAWDGGQLVGVTVARCTGGLRSNREMFNDGTPNGYMVVSVKDGDMTWYYKSVGQEQDYQLRVYSPQRTQSEYVKATIWNWSPNFWGMPQWYENGVKVGELERFNDEDVAYKEFYAERQEQKDPQIRHLRPSKSDAAFRIKPSEGVRSGEVRVTDNFGNTYTQTVEW